ILSSDYQENLIPSDLTVSTTVTSSVKAKPVNEAVAINLDYTKSTYNVSIPENAVYKYATSTEKMGIYISDPALSVRYKIVGGDPEKIFKAEAKRVGDFFFLLIRMRYGNNAVLNRE